MGLLALRLSAAALSMFLPLAAGFHPEWIWFGAAGLGMALVMGFMTRPSASLIGLGSLVAAFPSGEGQDALLAIGGLSALALALTGAGAYSIDARLHGRRVVTLEP